MARWSEFAAAAPEFSALAEQRFGPSGLILLGTIRANGWPRITPVESLVSDGQLYLGMMWRSRKALDLLRDPRCVVHSTVTDPNGTEGDVKVYGRGVSVDGHAEREAYCQALLAKIGWRPEGEEWHLFAIEVTEVGYIRGGADRLVLRWRPDAAVGGDNAPVAQ